MNFKGAAKRLDDIDLPKLGAKLGVGEDELHAFIDVETLGSGFDEQGRPRILFERHKFHKYVPAAKRAQAVKAGLASKTPGGYGKSSEQYSKLERAMKIDAHAALMSCSWDSVKSWGSTMNWPATIQSKPWSRLSRRTRKRIWRLRLNSILRNKLDDDLRRHDWKGFAKGYNGSNYAINEYDRKSAAAYAKWSRIKDTPWTPDTAPIPAPKPTGETVVVVPAKDVTIEPVAPVANKKTGLYAIAAVIISALVAWFQNGGQ